MKIFKFPLQKVLEYKEHIQNKEKEALAAMRQEYNLLEKRLYSLNDEYERNKSLYLRKCDEGTSVSQITVMLGYINEIEKQIEQVKEMMAQQILLIDKQIEKLAGISKEKITVEKLKDRKYETYKTLERKSEELYIEEFVSYKDATK